MTPRNKRQQDADALITSCQVFFAFSREQLEEGKAKIGISDNKELTDIGSGGFMPKKNLPLWIDGMEKIAQDFKQAMKDEKEREAYIRYELDNHEAYYTRSIESTLDALGDDFTHDEVWEIFKHSQNVKII